jgi:hypothetical protein
MTLAKLRLNKLSSFINPSSTDLIIIIKVMEILKIRVLKYHSKLLNTKVVKKLDIRMKIIKAVPD